MFQMDCTAELMLFIIERNNIGTAVCAALTLSVKEDAALYVFAAALFIILTREKKLRGVILLIAAGGYFVFASKMITVFGGSPVGLETLAASLGEDSGTIEDVYEPYLLKEGYISRTPRGRIPTAQAYEHMHIPMPAGD